MMAAVRYRVWIHGECVAEELTKLPQKRWRAINNKLKEGAAGREPLHGALTGLWKITNGGYRCVFDPVELNGHPVARVLHVGPRGNVYDETEILRRREDWG